MKTRSPRLTAEDWVKAGLHALIEGGGPAIRIDTLAAPLNATKGSFYWHFKDIRTLKLHLIEAWLHKGMLNMIHHVEPEKTPRGKLLAIARLGVSDPDPELSCARIEAAMREWSRQDTEVAQYIAASDEKRLEYVVKLFEEIGFDGAEARRRAALLLSVYIGLLHLNVLDSRIFPISFIGLAEMLADPASGSLLPAGQTATDGDGRRRIARPLCGSGGGDYLPLHRRDV